ncbi:putative sterigmatocystin biosynthesis P450 monooxygenase stcS [Paramyrothecium foliicola]|nr:putative sterigmatocystin biosynthesis P450 monooxygenase stcS [Paramyrothecium foliicola]
MPPWNPLLGHLLELPPVMKNLPEDTQQPDAFEALCKAYEKDESIIYVDTWPFAAPMIVVCSPALAVQVCQEHDLPKPPILHKFFNPLAGGANLFTMNGPEWKQSRSLFNPGFSEGYILQQTARIVKEAKVYVEVLREHSETGKMFSLDDVTCSYAMDIIGSVTLDSRLQSQRQYNPLSSALRRQIRWHVLDNDSWQMNNYISKELDKRYAEWVDGTAMSSSRSIMHLVLSGYMAQHKGKPLPKTLDPVFKKWATIEIRLFLFAGHDSTSSTICYCYYLLQSQPETMDRLRKEHDNVLGTDFSQTAERICHQPTLINQLPYTTAVIKETLRLFPPASAMRGGFKGVFLQDTKGNRYPTEGANIWVLHSAIQRNPKYWADPFSFRPERWLVGPSDPLYPVKGGWRPFEHGPRNCLGQPLAMLDIKVTLALTIREFDICHAYDEWDHQHPTTKVKHLVETLRQLLTDDERNGFDPRIIIVPSCYDDDETYTAFLFTNLRLKFLSALDKKPLSDWPVETSKGDLNFDRHFHGFTQLYKTPKGKAIVADLVAITGLDGHAYGSWRGRGPLQRMWLQDFLAKDLPRCRTLIYGYNSKMSSRGINTLLDYCAEFLEELKMVRATEEEARRPLILLGHSFGGLIIAQVLIKAKQYDRDSNLALGSLYDTIVGMMFFATPHRGLLVDDIQAMVCEDPTNPRAALVQELGYESQRLRDQISDFKNLIRGRQIVNFIEMHQTRRLIRDPGGSESWSGSGDFITALQPESALLDLPDHEGVKVRADADHSSIVKLDTSYHSTYRHAIKYLKEFQQTAIIQSHVLKHHLVRNNKSAETFALPTPLVFSPDAESVTSRLESAVPSEMTSVPVSRPKVRRIGLTVLHNPPDPVADIVFIPGLGGDPWSTWSSGPHASILGSDTFWPADYLPKVCDSARIITWGYECAPGHDAKEFLQGMTGFLTDLTAIRPLGRSLLFVAHSLGGIFLKEALRLAELSESPETRDIVGFTTAVLFFGTPHRGDGIRRTLTDVVRLVTNTVLNIDDPTPLLPEVCRVVESSKRSFISQYRAYGIQVFSFIEEKREEAVDGIEQEFVVTVPWFSAAFHRNDDVVHIGAGHMNICRFTSLGDPGYISVSCKLRDCVEKVSNGDLHLRDDALRSLSFAELSDREFGITPALEETATWLFDNAEYLSWSRWEIPHTENVRGLLWVKGKPGSGKSTLMKEGLRRAKARSLAFDPSNCIAGFFFTTRSNIQLQKTPLGLFRSIIYDLIRQDRALLCAFISEYRKKLARSLGPWKWHQEELKSFFRSAYTGAVSGVRKAVLFIDALDECGNGDNYDSARTLFELFRDITAENKLKVCLSSRHYPNIKMPGCLQVIVEKFNHEDVLRFVDKKLSQVKNDDRAQSLAKKIAEKAEGVFLWVDIVVKNLNIGLDNDKTDEDLDEILKAVPKSLEDVFKQLFTEPASKQELQKAAAIFQWVLLAARPLEIDELRHALTINGENKLVEANCWEESSCSLPDDPDRFLTSLRFYTRGLAEVVSREPNPDTTFDEPDEEMAGPTTEILTENIPKLQPRYSGNPLLDRIRLCLESPSQNETLAINHSLYFLDKYVTTSQEELRLLDYAENRYHGVDNVAKFPQSMSIRQLIAEASQGVGCEMQGRQLDGLVRNPEPPYDLVPVGIPVPRSSYDDVESNREYQDKADGGVSDSMWHFSWPSHVQMMPDSIDTPSGNALQAHHPQPFQLGSIQSLSSGPPNSSIAAGHGLPTRVPLQSVTTDGSDFNFKNAGLFGTSAISALSYFRSSIADQNEEIKTSEMAWHRPRGDLESESSSPEEPWPAKRLRRYRGDMPANQAPLLSQESKTSPSEAGTRVQEPTSSIVNINLATVATPSTSHEISPLSGIATRRPLLEDNKAGSGAEAETQDTIQASDINRYDKQPGAKKIENHKNQSAQEKRPEEDLVHHSGAVNTLEARTGSDQHIGPSPAIIRSATPDSLPTSNDEDDWLESERMRGCWRHEIWRDGSCDDGTWHYDSRAIELNHPASSRSESPDPSYSTIQFIHESVREYFLHNQGFEALEGSHTHTPIPNRHSAIAENCLACLDLYQRQQVDSGSSEIDISRDLEDLPFLEYATRFLFYHTYEAEKGGVVPTKVVSGLLAGDGQLWATWIMLNIFLKERESELVSLGDQDSLYRLSSEIRDLARSDRVGCPGFAPFHFLCQAKLYLVAAALLSHGVDVDIQDSEGTSALHYAVLDGDADTISFLVNNMANLHIQDAQGRRPLHKASMNATPCHEPLLALLNDKACLSDVDFKGNTPLHEAASRNNLDFVRMLLSYGADVCSFNHDGDTALHLAARQGHDEIVLTLIQLGANPNVKNRQQQMPIHVAAAHENPYSLWHLLGSTSDIDMRDGEGMTPLHIRILNSWNIRLLVNIGADIEARTPQGTTPLILATTGAHANIENIMSLIEGGVDCNATDTEGKTLLHHVAVTPNLLFLQNFLNVAGRHQNFSRHDNSGLTALHYAAQQPALTAFWLFLEYGIDCNMADRDGKTVLHHAAVAPDLSTIEKILQLGGASLDLSIPDDSGMTPLHYAAQQPGLGAFRLLIDAGGDLTAADNTNATPVDYAGAKVAADPGEDASPGKEI